MHKGGHCGDGILTAWSRLRTGLAHNQGVKIAAALPDGGDANGVVPLHERNLRRDHLPVGPARRGGKIQTGVNHHTVDLEFKGSRGVAKGVAEGNGLGTFGARWHGPFDPVIERILEVKEASACRAA